MHRRENRLLPTVKDAIDLYIQNRSAVLSPASLRGYITMQQNYFAEIEEISIADLTNSDIQKVINSIALTRSPKTVKNAASLLISALRQANPEKRYIFTLPKARAIERNIPDNEDVIKLLEASRSNRNLYLAIILSALGTLRRGEVCAIKYEDILRDFNAIYIHSDVVKDHDNNWIYKDYAKNAQSTRQVIYPKEVIDLIGQGEGYILIVLRMLLLLLFVSSGILSE